MLGGRVHGKKGGGKKKKTTKKDRIKTATAGGSSRSIENCEP